MSSTATDAAAKGRWESTPAIIWRYVAVGITAVGGAFTALWSALGWGAPGWRVALAAVVVFAALAAAVLQVAEAVAKHRREARESTLFERMRSEYSAEFASLFGALADALDKPGERGPFESFIGDSAEKFLTLVGNENRCLRVAIYRLDGREDDDTPEDDYRLERIGTRPHGRADLPRFEFRYTDEVEREVIDALWGRTLITWPDLTKDAPRGHDPSKMYKAFYTMPVVSPSNKVKGMITCDSTEVGLLGKQHEQSLRMIAHLVSVGLTLTPKKARIVLVDEDAEG